MARKHLEDFGPLAMAIRQLPCAVIGCDRASVPAHVRSRNAGYGAWIIVDGHNIGNLAPLCSGHHTGGSGIPRDHTQHQGIRTFERSVGLAVKLPGRPERRVDRLAEVAEAVGEWFLQTTKAPA